jgi:hypothetical protein
MDTRERDEQIIRLLNEFISTRDQLSAAATDNSGLFAPVSRDVQMKRFLEMLKGYSYQLFALLPQMATGTEGEPLISAFAELVGSHRSELVRLAEGRK